ncbi:unnamed protein product [Penicillium nalgiovense]|nr:unnamed protein product [Penicillium nalgiovense]
MRSQTIDISDISFRADGEGGSKRAPPNKSPYLEEEKVFNDEPQQQDVFGDEEFAEVKYKVLKWWECGLLMVAETISLGILSLPAALAGLGLVPGVICLIGLGVLATYTGYVISQFKLKYPQISSVADAGEILMGPFGRELFFASHMLYLVFIGASHLLTFAVAMNTITEQGTCSLVFGVVGMVISFLLSLPRTMRKMTWLSLASFLSIIAAVLVAMVAIGIQDKDIGFSIIKEATLTNSVISICNIAFSFASHNTFFSMMAELEDPKQFPKALALLQSIDICLYVTISIVIYRYAGDSVTSPALGSVGLLASKISYGVALPTIIIAGVIYGHVAIKTVYIRIFAGTDRMHKTDIVAVGSWIGLASAHWIIAWIIASAIPVFSNLLSLMSALFASWFSFGIPGILWLFMNKGSWFSSLGKISVTVLNVVCVIIGVIMCGLGVYASGKAIHDSPSTGSFSCASNH